MTFVVSQIDKAGFVSVKRQGGDSASLVYVGGAAQHLANALSVQPLAELPAQKWCSVIAA